MKRIMIIIVILVMTFMVIGCKTEEEIFVYKRIIQGIGTISTQNTNAIFLEPIESPQPLLGKGFDGEIVETVCIVVNQSYPQIDDDFGYPIDWVIQRMLARIGIKGVLAGDPFLGNEYLQGIYQKTDIPCQGTLEFDLRFEAISEEYESVGLRYTGAEVSGEMTFIVPDQSISTSRMLVPNTINPRPGIFENDQDNWKSPQAAPLSDVWQYAVIDGLYGLWGYPIVIQSEAEETMEEYRLHLHKWLVNRSGQDYGNDVDAWMEWWDQYSK